MDDGLTMQSKDILPKGKDLDDLDLPVLSPDVDRSMFFPILSMRDDANAALGNFGQ